MVKTNDKGQLKILKKHLIAHSNTEEHYLQLKHFIENDYPFGRYFELSIQDKWDIVVKLHFSKSLNATQKQIFRDYMCYNDQTEMKKNTLFYIQGLQANEQQQEELMRECMSKDRKFSYIELENVIDGLSNLKRGDKLTAQLYSKFYDNALNLILHDQQIMATTYFNEGFPQTEDF